MTPLKMRFWTKIRKTIHHSKKKHPHETSPTTSSSSSSPANPQLRDDQKDLHSNILSWLQTIKHAPAPGHRFNGHTLGIQRLTPRNLAMLDAGLRPMPVFGPEELTMENVKMFCEEMGPLEGVWEIFGFDCPRSFVGVEEGDIEETSESGATTGSSRFSA